MANQQRILALISRLNE